MTRPWGVVGTTPKREGSSTWCSAIVASPPWVRWKAKNLVTSRLVSTFAIDHEEGLVESGLLRRETDSAGGVERFGFNGVGDVHTGDHAGGIGLDEAVGQITQGQTRRR